jgi:hypothetical protein
MMTYDRWLAGALAAATVVTVSAGAANAQQYDRRNFNWNAAGCPPSPAGLSTVQVDKFTDGSPLPSCGTTANGHPVKLVWTGQRWAVFGPSMQHAAAPSPPPMAPPKLDLVPHASDFRVDSTQLGYSRGRAPAVGQRVTYGGKQYVVTQVVAQGGGNLLTDNGGAIISHDGGTLTVVLRLLTSDGAGVVGSHGSGMQLRR